MAGVNELPALMRNRKHDWRALHSTSGTRVEIITQTRIRTQSLGKKLNAVLYKHCECFEWCMNVPFFAFKTFSDTYVHMA